MKIGIISDIHGNIGNLLLAIGKMNKQGVEKILCLGDIGGVDTAAKLAALDVPVFSIMGNNDVDGSSFLKVSHKSNGRLEMSSETWAELELGGRKIFISHYPDIAQDMAYSEKYDAVFHGHTHEMKVESINSCILMNPGEIVASRTGVISYGIYDTENNRADVFRV